MTDIEKIEALKKAIEDMMKNLFPTQGAYIIGESALAAFYNYKVVCTTNRHAIAKGLTDREAVDLCSNLNALLDAIDDKIVTRFMVTVDEPSVEVDPRGSIERSIEGKSWDDEDIPAGPQYQIVLSRANYMDYMKDSVYILPKPTSREEATRIWRVLNDVSPVFELLALP